MGAGQPTSARGWACVLMGKLMKFSAVKGFLGHFNMRAQYGPQHWVPVQGSQDYYIGNPEIVTFPFTSLAQQIAGM